MRHLPFQASGRTPLLARARERRARKKDHQDAKTHPAPCGRRGQGMLTGAVFREAPARHLPFQASGRPTLPSPLVEEGGRGNEGQKARECRKPHHHAGRSGVHRLFLVEQPAGCVECGLKARAPWLWRAARRLRRMRAGSPRTRLKACAPWQCRAAHLSHRMRDGGPRTPAIQAGCCRNRYAMYPDRA